MGVILLRLLPFLLLLIVVLVLFGMAKRKPWNSRLVWVVLGLLSLSIIGGGLTLFFTENKEKQPHRLTPNTYIDGQVVPGRRE